MMWSLFAIVLLATAQSVVARPDYGLVSDAVGTVNALGKASAIYTYINFLDDLRVDLTSNYSLLYDERNALYTIAQNVTSLVGVMVQNVITLVDDDNGVVAPLFQTALTSIGNVQTLLRTGFTQDLQTLRARNKTYITDMLADSFDHIGNLLTVLDTTLRTLESDVVKVQIETDGKRVPILQNVAPRKINALLNTIDRLMTKIPSLMHTVQDTLREVGRGDGYIITANTQLDASVTKINQAIATFSDSLRQLKVQTVNVISDIGPAYEAQQSQITPILPQLQASSNYLQKLDYALETYDISMSPGSIEDKTVLLDETIADYIARSATFGSDLATLYAQRVLPVVRAIVQVNVARGPYASYCYEKYAQRGVDMCIHNVYDMGECYEVELNRMYALYRLISRLMDMVGFNLNDLYGNLNACVKDTTCPGTCDPCIAIIGKFLDVLSRLMDETFDLILQIVPYEAIASLQRLKSCTAFSKYRLIADAHDLSNAIYLCEGKGYTK